MSTFSTACLAVALAILLAWFGPGLDITDHSAEIDQAKELEHAQRQAQIVRRFERAAQTVCGPNAAWQLLTDGVTILCRDKHGRRTITAQVPL